MNKTMYHCFDVFDTVLTRIWVQPQYVFREMEDEEWMRIRQHAEQAVCTRIPGEYVRLEDIYQEIRRRMSWTPEQQQATMQQELACERASIRPVPSQIELIRNIHEAGHSVLFISAMYLPAEFMKSVLEEHEIWKDGDQLYMSCEYKRGKRSGELLQTILKETNIPPSSLVMHGNTIEEDIKPARTSGMNTVYVPDCEPTEYELIPEHADFAGISRIARIHQPNLSPAIADCIAPLLFFTTLWMINQAQHLNIRRIYFLSRDGYFMHRIAERIAPALGIDIELKYLFVSRQSLTNDSIGYLLQEGFADGTPYAIADIGWLGTIQTALEQIIEDAGYPIALPVTGLYFCFLGTTKQRANTYSFLEARYSGIFEQDAHKDIIETFITSHSASVTEYAYTDGTYIPTYEQPVGIPGNSSATQNAIDIFTREMIVTGLYKRISHPQAQQYVHRLLALLISSKIQTDKQTTTTPRLLNIGCGNRTHPAWTNIDKVPTSQDVTACNILGGLPYQSSSFNVVYHSHLLEHLAQEDGMRLMWECRRILKPGGIIRIAVPDLERLAQSYLISLHQEPEYHEWAILSLFDQFARTFSGGRANQFIARAQERTLQQFLITQWGNVARQILGQLPSDPPTHIKRRFMWKVREVLIKILLRDEYELLTTARFRESGEIHQWMYDRKNLSDLLTATSFTDITIHTAHTSGIPNWSTYNLDTEPDGTIVKPDSLYIEARAS